MGIIIGVKESLRTTEGWALSVEGLTMVALEGMSATGVDQSTESTEKAQAPGSSSPITQHLTKPWFDDGVTYSGFFRSCATSYATSPKHFQCRLASLAPKLAGHLYLNYKAFTVQKNEEILYLSSSGKLSKNAPN